MMERAIPSGNSNNVELVAFRLSLTPYLTHFVIIQVTIRNTQFPYLVDSITREIEPGPINGINKSTFAVLFRIPLHKIEYFKSLAPVFRRRGFVEFLIAQEVHAHIIFISELD